MQRSDAAPRILGDRYELRVRLGSGGAGAVWLAYDRALARSVAVKLLHADLAEDPAVELRFRTEATAAARLTHHYAVQVYDVGRDGSDDYLVMELVEGPSLAALLQDGPLPAGIGAAVGNMVAEALGAAHEASIVHRDVKPGNVLHSPDGTVKLADFGIARLLGAASARLTRAGTVLGTARYLAPEQLGNDPVDARADVYALGLVLYEALTGSPPFGEGSPVEIATRRLTTTLPPARNLADGVPDGLDEVIQWAIQLDPDERPDNGSVMASALAAFASSDAVPQLARRVRDHAGTPSTADELSTPEVSTPPPVRPPAEPVGFATRDPTRELPVSEESGRPIPPPSPAPGVADDRTSTMQPTDAPRDDASAAATTRPTTGRWLLVVGIAVVIVLAALLVRGDGISGLGGAESPAPPPSPETELTIADAGDHDPPPGDLRERPEEVGNAIDRDLDTFWPTESYNSADLGGFPKDGVGLWVSLEEPASIDHVEITFSRDGGEMELWVGEGTPGEEQQPTDWGTLVHEGAIGSEVLRIEDLPSGTVGDTILLWFTDLPPGGNGFRVEVRDVRIYGG